MLRRLPTPTTVVAAAAALALIAGCTATTDGRGRLASAGPSGGTSVSPGATLPAQTPVSFHDCKQAFNLTALTYPAGRVANLGIGCATVDVPLDYADPSGRTIAIQLVRVHDLRDTAPRGQLLVDPGGPGGSGVELAVGLSAQVSNRLLSRFDLVGFDPRGVGFSAPIKCLTDAQKDALNAASPNVLTPSGFEAAKRSAKQVADACSAKYGAALAQYDTVQTARDMDRIRQAVGDSRMNYLGFSYGTELGSVYAHLFPKTVRAMVLDGAVDPLTDDLTSFANQIRGFESAFDQFANWCRVHSPCRTLGDPRAAVAAVVAKATAAPLRSSAKGETRTATSSIVYTGVLSALYSKDRWPDLGAALVAGGRGDAKGLFALADEYNQRYNGRYTNIAESGLAIGCNDSKPGPSDATIRATARRWATEFPLFGLWSAASLFSCQQWQPDRSVPPRPTAPTPHPVLVIGNLHDPATPYQGAKDLARTMGNARLLSWDGQGHTSYLQGSTCVDRYVDDYLLDLTLPPANRTCPA